MPKERIYSCESCGKGIHKGDNMHFGWDVNFCEDCAPHLSDCIHVHETAIEEQDVTYFGDSYETVDEMKDALEKLQDQLIEKGDYKILDMCE